MSIIADIDECADAVDGDYLVCEPDGIATCANSDPLFTCSCSEGYAIKDDNTLCEGKYNIFLRSWFHAFVL